MDKEIIEIFRFGETKRAKGFKTKTCPGGVWQPKYQEIAARQIKRSQWEGRKQEVGRKDQRTTWGFHDIAYIRRAVEWI